jgi:hypothetical protein
LFSNRQFTLFTIFLEGGINQPVGINVHLRQNISDSLIRSSFIHSLFIFKIFYESENVTTSGEFIFDLF